MRLLPALCLFAALLTAAPSAFGADRAAAIDQVRQDLNRLESPVVRAAAYQEGMALPGTDGRPIKPREVYAAYLTRAESLSARLIRLGEQLQPSADGESLPSLSLQQAGALTQRLSAENARFRDSFRHGEDQFESYRMIQTAVASLEDAIAYWRMANRYRRLYRGLASDKAEDDEVLRTRLQTAMTAIERLRAIREMRTALNELDQDTYP